MTCSLRHLVLCLTVLALAFGTVFAQDEDVFLQRYTLAMDNFNQAINALPSDSALSKEELDRAEEALRPLSRDTTSPNLIAALEATFARARTAIQNQSPDDLAVQIAVLRGGYQRLAFESALVAAEQADIDAARARMTRIASDMNLSADTQSNLSAATNPIALRTSLEAGIAASIRQNLARTGDLFTEAKGASYRNLAEAYGMFLIVQDSPRLAQDMTGNFSNAFSALVNNETETLTNELIAVSEAMQDLETAALNGETSVAAIPPVTPDSEVADSTVAPDPSVVAPDSTSDVTTDADTTPETTDATNTVAPLPALTTTPEAPAIDTEAMRAQLIEEQKLESVEAVTRSLAMVGARDNTSLVERYVDAGYADVDAVMNDLYATAAKAVVAVETGDQVQTQALLAEYETTYERFVAPIVTAKDAAVANTTSDLLRTWRGTTSLRLQDMATLVGQTEAMSLSMNNQSSSGVHNAVTGLSKFWTGLPRLIVTILLSILAFVPLYLLNLAFGGGNRNWQLIGVALFLLLLPVIYEGVSYIFGLIASVANIPVLDSVATFSIFQNSISQLIWLIITALAIIFAISGLYGICVQFGLLGKERVSTAATSEAPIHPTGETAADTVVDWDEEF